MDVTGRCPVVCWGAAAEWSPYQVFLDNLAISQTALDAQTVQGLLRTHRALGSYLMNVCNDVGNWFSVFWSQGNGDLRERVLDRRCIESEFRAILRNRALLRIMNRFMCQPQWAQMEWNFAAAYLSDPPPRPMQCLRKRAGFIDGGYFTCI